MSDGPALRIMGLNQTFHQGGRELKVLRDLDMTVDRGEAVLGQVAHLSAFVVYIRTPGNKGGGAHNDYKRWRPVGSSMNWLFAIVPLTDFDAEYGPLLVSPGSHKLYRMVAPAARILDVAKPDREQAEPRPNGLDPTH